MPGHLLRVLPSRCGAGFSSRDGWGDDPWLSRRVQEAVSVHEGAPDDEVLHCEGLAVDGVRDRHAEVGARQATLEQLSRTAGDDLHPPRNVVAHSSPSSAGIATSDCFEDGLVAGLRLAHVFQVGVAVPRISVEGFENC